MKWNFSEKHLSNGSDIFGRNNVKKKKGVHQPAYFVFPLLQHKIDGQMFTQKRKIIFA